ncbi:DNA repair protein RecO [Pararhodobacter oceanensis]|uniref:DNA repair protein RecO n=1 Tax=Pararhodobacter oceanensis TaxID=2172121 RepID=A0A2T8HUF1_9RHOB|nr:DNA repair protein RecO [Pararhodobacter oceanensis]PVH29087.1 DNA repair protein RecO [Pararhodobacter oceanensis]
MEWTGEGTLLAARPHGESAAIIEVLTEARGLHRGVVRGGSGRRMAPVLQPGARLHLVWRARLDDQLGTFTVEPIRARAATIMGDADRLAALNAVCALTVFSLPERDPHPRFYAATEHLLDLLSAAAPWFGAYLAWERLLLEETGYGLDLGACAVTGAVEGLAYVSPRSGRAVTEAGAGEFADRLLPLPMLLRDEEAPESREQMAAGLRTTGYFLHDILAPALGKRPLPEARTRLVSRFSGGR